MKELFDKVSADCSRITTNKYSTSFSLGIKFLAKKFHNPIYDIYGFVLFANEIVYPIPFSILSIFANTIFVKGKIDDPFNYRKKNILIIFTL